MIAVDASMLIYLWLPTEKTAVAEKVFRRDPDWVAPHLWRSEFRNVVSLYIRRGVPLEIGLEATARAENFMKGHEYQVSTAEVMRLANESGCTTYDCEYVQIARLKSVPLITFNSRILTRFPYLSINPEEFIEVVK